MARSDFRTPRLYVDTPLGPSTRIALDKSQAHYLRNVLRLAPGDPVLFFNGRDGEWRGSLDGVGKRDVTAAIEARTREQTLSGDLHYLFAPLKHERLDYMVQKAVEMGVSRLQPVITKHVQTSRINLDRMRANSIEAAEQSGGLNLPEIGAPLAFDAMLAELEAERLLVFCDEEAKVSDPVRALASRGDEKALPVAVIIGPEGGFSAHERATLVGRPNTVRVSLGPRILRADTAAVAALTLVQAALGDWR